MTTVDPRRYAAGIVSSRSIVLGLIAGLSTTHACASPPQEDSTALVEPEPRPTEEPVEDVSPTPVTVDETSPSSEPEDTRATTAPEPSTPPEPSSTALTGIAICDEYLSLYQRCEEHLRPEIMAGDRRFYRSEAASLQHLASTPEAAGLPDACRSMLDRLRVDCPAQHRRSPAASSAGPGTSP